VKLDTLLREAARAINEELAAAGHDEVKQHPTFRWKLALLNTIDRAQGR